VVAEAEGWVGGEGRRVVREEDSMRGRGRGRESEEMNRRESGN
jgi:hypothetical protein